MIDGNQLREEFGRYLAEHKATRWGMDAALMHVCKIAYDAGRADGPATPERRIGPASDADMAVYQSIADGYTRDTAPPPAEVPMPDIQKLLRSCGAPAAAFRTAWKDGIDIEEPDLWIEDFCRQYGDAREAAGYARGLAEAGGVLGVERGILDAALLAHIQLGAVPEGWQVVPSADQLWNNDEVMALNAELGLTMDQLSRLASAITRIAHPADWRERFSQAVYDDLAAADNQDFPLEEYPARILKVLDAVIGREIKPAPAEVPMPDDAALRVKVPGQTS